MRPAHGPEAVRQRATVVVVWCVACALALLVAARTRYVADLSAFLPAAPTSGQALLLEQLKSGVASRLFLIGIEGGDARARAAASRALAQALHASGTFETVANGDNTAWADIGRVLFEHRYLLSPAVDAERFTTAGLRAAIDESLALLGTPAGALLKPVLLRDPTGETARIAEAMLPAQSPRIDEGVWASRQAPRAVLVATTKAAGSDLDAQERAIEAVRAAFAAHAPPGLRVEITGAPAFAVASREQIHREVARLAMAGSVLVLALLCIAFRRVGAVAMAALPVATGVLAGIAAVSLWFGHVHAMTLGFGTTLIGEAVDYAIYYLVQARDVGHSTSGARHWIDSRWPTVRLGLLTSVCGFGALVFSGFPGLAQLGVYSIAGLVAAALATRYGLTALAPSGAKQAVRLPSAMLQRAMEAVLRARWPLLALTAAAVLVLAVHPTAWRGNISGLSPVDPALVRLDEELRADVGAPDSGTLVAVSAPSLEQTLQVAEAVGARLDALVDAGSLRGYESPARLLPSARVQLARRAALPDAPTLSARLAEATRDGPLPAARLAPFVADVQAARSQAPLDRAALEGTALGSAVDALLSHDARGWRAFLSLQSGPNAVDTQRLRSQLADVPGAELVQVKPELDALYAHYLHEAIVQASAGGAAIVVLLALRLRSPRRLARVLAPLAGAIALVLAALTLAGTVLGILHLVGLLLVVAVGSNYALFFDHLRADARSDEAPRDTLASLVLANLTTSVSFGLLAFSGIPVLQAIGRVVAPAALLCLLLSAAWVGNAQGPHGKMRAS